MPTKSIPISPKRDERFEVGVLLTLFLCDILDNVTMQYVFIETLTLLRRGKGY